MICAFTTSTPDQAGAALTLFRSLRRHCPDLRLVWVVADRRSPDLMAAIPVHAADSIMFATDPVLGLDPAWIFSHDQTALPRALRPRVAETLLAEPECEGVLWFSCDTVVFRNLGEVTDLVRSDGIVVAPALPDAAVESSHPRLARLVLGRGALDGCFMGVGDSLLGREFVSWWSGRSALLAGGVEDHGLLSGGAWLDLVPVLFPDARFLARPGFGVDRFSDLVSPVSGTFDEGFHVGGETLELVHLPDTDGGMVLEVRSGRTSVSFRMIRDWYEAFRDKQQSVIPTTWLLGAFADGTPIEAEHRAFLRSHPELRMTASDPFHLAADDSFWREVGRGHS